MTEPDMVPGPALCAELSAFITSARRLPRLGDPRPPWQFRGWLLPYVIQLHAHLPSVADRWGYHLRTLEAGKLLDEPIPQVHFAGSDPKILPRLHQWCRVINRDCG